MIYIFCGAYKALMFALYIKNLGKRITIITYNKDIMRYCIEENIDYIKIEFIRPKVTSIYKVFTLKKVLDNIIKKIDFSKENAFILFGDAKAYDSFYLAQEFSKKGVVYYKNPDRKSKKYKAPKFKPIFFRGGIIRIVLKLILRLDLIYYRSDIRSPCFGIDDNFLKKNNIVEYEPNIPSEELILEAVKKSKSNFKEFDNLIIDDGGPLENIIKFDSTIKLYEKLFRLPIEFAFKKHPKPTTQESQSDLSFYELFKHCEELPNYIPVELFCNNIKKNVISIFSTSLITASQLQHLKAVSLLELVDWYDESYKKELKNYLMKESKNKIIFLNGFEELKKILLNS